jgi:hypothetical protein
MFGKRQMLSSIIGVISDENVALANQVVASIFYYLLK